MQEFILTQLIYIIRIVAAGVGLMGGGLGNQRRDAGRQDPQAQGGLCCAGREGPDGNGKSDCQPAWRPFL